MKNAMLSVGYKKWVLWLLVLFDICLIPILAILPFVDVEGMTFIWRVIYALPVIYIAGHLTIVLGEIFRSGVAVSIGREGILLHRVSDQIILWDKIKSVTVHSYEFVDPRRYIEIKCTAKATDFRSPYPLINLHRFLTLGHLRNTVTMDLGGVDAKDIEIRRAIHAARKKRK